MIVSKVTVSKVIVSKVFVSTVIVSKVIVSTMIPVNKFYTNFKLGIIKQSQQSFVYKKILHIPLQHRQTQNLEAIKYSQLPVGLDKG